MNPVPLKLSGDSGLQPTSAVKRIIRIALVTAIVLGGSFGVMAVAQVAVAPVPAEKPALTGDERLSSEDAARYAHIFAFQEIGNWQAADREIAKLSDLRLMGHVLKQRYMHPTAYRASYDELKSWLARYNDHPGAKDVYELALRRKPAGAASPKKPELTYGASGRLDLGESQAPYVSSRKRSSGAQALVRSLQSQVRSNIQRMAPTHALALLDNPKNANILDKVEADVMRAEVASGYFFAGKPDKAFEVAAAAADRSGEDAPLAGWVAGLSAWKAGDYAASARYFEIAASSPRASNWTASASAYWAARAHLRNHEPHEVTLWLKKAAEHRHTFYGLIAARALGRDVDFNWRIPRLKNDHVARLQEIPAGSRALALLDAEQPQLAEIELRRINPGNDKRLLEAMLALTAEAGLPSASMRLASAFADDNGGLIDAAMFPLAPQSWQPEDGYTVDRALIYAFIRQESRFNPEASSRSGARGLMQLMPQTASYVAGDSFSKREQRQLHEPVLNIQIGQKYLGNLLTQQSIGGDLFRLAVAYNAGPGNLARWDQKLGEIDDPLLFIESIPVAETRAFVERVMANYWIYRLRLKQGTPSLDAVAAGEWPVYESQDDLRVASADSGFFSSH